MPFPPLENPIQRPPFEVAVQKVNPRALGITALSLETVDTQFGNLSGLENRIADDQDKIKSLNTGLLDYRRHAAGYLALSELPNNLRTEIAGSRRAASDTEILGRLGGATKPGIPPVSKTTYLEFARWHHGNVAKKQTAFEATRLPQERSFFRQAVEKAARTWLPAKATERLERVEAAKVYLDDGFDTLFRAHDKTNGHALFFAGHDGKSHTIVLAPNAKRNTIVHEFSHGLAGRDDVPTTELGQKENVGLYRIFGTGAGGEAIEEAVNEHLASSLQNSHVEVTNPTSKYRRSEVYTDENKLLHALCTKGVRRISPRLFIDAQLEDGIDRDAAGPNSAQAKLVRALHEAFPDQDMIKVISDPDFKTPAWVAFNLGRQYGTRRLIASLLMKRRSR